MIGFGIDAYSAAVFFKAKTTVNPMRVTGAMYLVTSGLYRWSRNPMYCGLIIALIGWASFWVLSLHWWRSSYFNGFWSSFRLSLRN
jgi:protein-S-isoprenylcysteine O-methyltransferase Ste14